MTPKLPPLPRPDGPDVGQYTEETLRSAQLEAWRAAMECAAQECEARHVNTNYKYDTRYECAEAIRSLPLPE